MSMISAQCDELRAMAEIVGLAMPQAATLMMEAADTIERLREQTEDMDFQLDKWQTKAEYFKQLADLAEAENAKLRDENQSIGLAAYELGRNSMADENAKLRELLLDVADVLEEHTKLRELSERLRSAVSDGADNARDVLAENTKLRKLLLDVWNDAIRFDGFWDYVNDDGEIYNEDELPHYQDRMRELGIEAE